MDVETATNFGDESVVAVGTSFPAQEGTALPLDVLQPLSALRKVLPPIPSEPLCQSRSKIRHWR